MLGLSWRAVDSWVRCSVLCLTEEYEYDSKDGYPAYKCRARADMLCVMFLLSSFYFRLVFVFYN